MTELARDAAIEAAELLTHYSFDLSGFTIERLIDYWLREYPVNWLRFALVEALYQGRYKAVSVTQILTLWKRRGQPLHHFNHEFERMVCGKFPRTLIASPESSASSRTSSRASMSSDRPASSSLVGTRDVAPPYPPETVTPSNKAAEDNQTDAATPELTGVAPGKDEPSHQEAPAESGTGSPIRALLPAAKSPQSPLTASEMPPAKLDPAATPEASAIAEPPEASRKPPAAAAPRQPTDPESADSPIQTFKPVNVGLDTTELVQWAGDRMSKHPIHQFVPATGVSNFYTKLKAVVQNRDDYFTDLALAGDSVSWQED
ncbi:MAG: hypothetical protein HC840_27140 [Leptolyngbyaceae cyanobacterium RM2_2_4]|nr:hypothetical protein [Leptolyngbyaceae cyanobacterium SM1_4_3]NJO52464.1 hypothetical protein [Leptolyngbyaceae cyanobacterium RM2_2_4]